MPTYGCSQCCKADMENGQHDGQRGQAEAGRSFEAGIAQICVARAYRRIAIFHAFFCALHPASSQQNH